MANGTKGVLKLFPKEMMKPISKRIAYNWDFSDLPLSYLKFPFALQRNVTQNSCSMTKRPINLINQLNIIKIDLINQ